MIICFVKPLHLVDDRPNLVQIFPSALPFWICLNKIYQAPQHEDVE